MRLMLWGRLSLFTDLPRGPLLGSSWIEATGQPPTYSQQAQVLFLLNLLTGLLLMVIVLFLSKSAGGWEKGDERMARILTVVPEQARGLRKLMVRLISRQTGGMFPGIFQIIMRDFQVAIPTTWLYSYLNERKGSPLSRLQREMVATVVNGLVGGAPWLGGHAAAVRRLTNDEHLGPEFATTWPQYDLDRKTRALLTYAKKLTQEPSMVDDSDIEDLRAAGWDEKGIYEATALISFFNYSGRMEAASGLPMDEMPGEAPFAEATPGIQTVSD